MANKKVCDIQRRVSQTNKSCKTYSYVLKDRIENSFEDVIKHLGLVKKSLKTSPMLNIQGDNFNITAIRGLREVRLITKKGFDEAILIDFENLIKKL